MSREFVPALELNAGFYRDVVEPIVREYQHGAALLGYGSELLGFDTERSTDHGWGPRLQIFVDATEVEAVRAAVDAGLPSEYRGWPVEFGWDEVAVTHHVNVVPFASWVHGWIGCNPLAEMSLLDWLVIPQQRILGVVRGAVYHDPTGELARAREQLRCFPPELTMWLLACQWRHLWQEEPLVGRTAEVGDEVGSRLIAGHIVRNLMRLHFLLVGEYWPYAKWFGSAYRRLPDSAETLPHFAAALAATDHATREDALVGAYETIARLHNASGLTEPLDPAVTFFYARPFRVPDSDRFVQACLAKIDDTWLRSLPLMGSIDQCVDSTDVSENPAIARRLRAIYAPS